MIELVKKFLISNYCTDSRQVKSGSLFFALKGERVDGHTFLSMVAEKGAVAAVVNEDYEGPSFGLNLIPVRDVLEALQEMAREWLLHCGTRVVAITGSVGKTSTKEFLTTLLRQKYRVASSPGNSNSQVGLPLSLLNHLKETDEIWVQEMGMSERGNLSRLISIAPPEVAVLTSVALVHACNFESLKGIALAKSEIFGFEGTKLGIALKDCEHFSEICQVGKCPKESFSIQLEADYYLDPQNKLFRKGEPVFELKKMPVPGEHNRQNLLAAIVVAKYFEMEWDAIEKGVSLLSLPERRLQFIEKKGVQFVNDAYNASTVSMKASFKSLPKPRNGHKTVAILGEMLELGKFSEACHKEVGVASLQAVDRMICFGEGCGPIVECWQKGKKPVKWTSDWKELMKMARDSIEEGDVVLLKGSQANELWKVIEEL